MDFVCKVILVSFTLKHVQLNSALRLPRLSVAEYEPTHYFQNNIEGNPGVYSFNYDVSDKATGNTQYRTEDRYANGTVSGAYGYIDAFGTPQRFRYVADQAGYRVFRDSLFQPFVYGYQTTTLKPIDKIVIQPADELTWTRPKRPNKNKLPNKVGLENAPVRGTLPSRFNLIGSPSQYVAYD